MDLPIELKQAIEKQIEGMNQKQLINISSSISKMYMASDKEGKRLVKEKDEAIVYSIVRMPATFQAITSILEENLEYLNDIKTIIDVGAGTGAASWAVNSVLDIETITCLERENQMINIGKTIMEHGDNVLKNTSWKKYDALVNGIEEQADLVVCSYMINELDIDTKQKVLDQLWAATKKYLLIVEPGMPKAFESLKQTKNSIVSQNGHVIAPCPNDDHCPLGDNDWCHFSCRVMRTKLHKNLKGGSAPYEDEKYSYLLFSKEKIETNFRRILRHPYINKGFIDMVLCTKDGIVEERITKKNPIYKQSKKAKWGSSI